MKKFRVILPCKPYVKRFIEQNFGNPADLSKDKDLYNEFRSRLKKQSVKYDHRYINSERYSEEIEIRITQDDFYNFGWELSKTEIVTLNRKFEARAKTFLYTIVGVKHAMGVSLWDSIEYFQEKYDYPEAIWPKESIYKDCQRNLKIKKNVLSDNISSIIDNICLVKLSANRTISPQVKKLI